jgi:guanylate kinase
VFVDRQTFEAALADGGFLEHTEFLGNLYGTPIPRPEPGTDLLLEIEVDGAGQVRSIDPDALLIYVAPPSVEELERRLRGRGDPDDVIARRLAKEAEEASEATRLGATVVVNDDLDGAVEEILDHISRARNR